MDHDQQIQVNEVPLPQAKASLSLTKECKHSARFDALDQASESVIGTLYLDKQAWLMLNRPSKILITVQKG